MSITPKTIWVINYFAGTSNSGWGERHYFLSKTWLDKGYKVSLISSSFNHLFTSLPEVKGHYTLENVKGRTFCWVKTPKYKSQSILRFWSMWVFAVRSMFVPSKMLGEPDVVIVSSMPIFPVFCGLYFRWKYKSKFIFEVRDLWPLSLIELVGVSKNNPAVKIIGWFERLGYKKADAIVSLLPLADTYINSISGDPSKFNWIPNGSDDNSISGEDAPDSLLAKIPMDKFIIGYTGSFGHANALSFLMEAVKILRERKEIYFILVGDGHQKDALVKEVCNLSNITFLPQVKKSQVRSLVEKFDVCYIGWRDLPLYKYGVSANKYFDYMIASKPVLVSSGRIKDPVELSGCGLTVAAENPDAIAEGILKMYSMSPEDRKAMGEKGREYVLKYHNYLHLSEQYEELFV